MRKLRVFLLVSSLLIFPVTLNFMSPVLSLQAAAEGIIAGSLLLFLFMFASAPLIGRLWCGWLCPGGALQDLVAPINGKKPGRHNDMVKYGIWGIWFGAILYFLSTRGIEGIAPLYMTETGVSVDEPF